MTDVKDLKRLRGAAELLSDAVEHGTSAIERVHLATAARPFAILEAITPTAPVARGVHIAHDAIAQGVYGTIRVVNRLARSAVNVAIDLAEVAEAVGPSGPPPAPDPSFRDAPAAAPETQPGTPAPGDPSPP